MSMMRPSPERKWEMNFSVLSEEVHRNIVGGRPPIHKAVVQVERVVLFRKVYEVFVILSGGQAGFWRSVPLWIRGEN